MIHDIKIGFGVASLAAAGGATWLDQANDIGTLVLTIFGILAACMTVWYTWERATKLRKERKEQK